MKKNKLIIGRSDVIALPEWGIEAIKAKVDTGAYTSAIHCKNIKVIQEGEEALLTFTLTGFHEKAEGLNKKGIKKVFRTRAFQYKKIKSSTGHSEYRYIVNTRIRIFGQEFPIDFSLSDRSKMRFPVLLGRKMLKNRFLVDVNQVNLSFKTQNQKGL